MNTHNKKCEETKGKIKISCLDKYDFLKILSKEDSEEFEVTNEAMNYYWENYSIYSKDNGWEKEGYASRRNQMSTSGCWLHCSNKEIIDIAGDILTSVSAFSGLEKIHPDLHKLFERLYHTIGNCIPWPEGGNLGGRPWKDGGSPDNYYRKIMICYKIINKNENYDTKYVSCRIASNKTLGGMGYSSIQYWIDEIWKGKTWEDFVKINFLEDMVDKELRPIPFELYGEEVEQDKIKNIYLNNIKRIICRGYRITNKGKLNKTCINKIYNELGID